MAIVSGIPLDGWQVEELGKIEFPDELHLVEEPDGRWTVDNGDMIVFEFIPEKRTCPDCGSVTIAPAEDGYRECRNCGWDSDEDQGDDGPFITKIVEP